MLLTSAGRGWMFSIAEISMFAVGSQKPPHVRHSRCFNEWKHKSGGARSFQPGLHFIDSSES